jgi:hypothetical protein
LPLKRLLGDMSDLGKVLHGLGLDTVLDGGVPA